MNILIPHTWLLEHLDTAATPTEIQKYVSLSGPSIERIYQREGESVYDIEVTTNRVDSMSVRGIARESAVILQQFGIKAKLKPLHLPKPSLKASTEVLPLPKIINNPEVCRRTMAVILHDVKRTPTPEWMAKRLRQIDANVHDSVIDITNYVTHELGHPCHAFDYDQIMKLGGEIRVVIAKAGKKFTTLDGMEYTTVGGEVVFENQKGQIIDLPAIKGTLNTSINDNTKNILFWMENLDAKKVRFGSMTHAIRTVAAQLNEKNVDPHLMDPVLDLATKFYRELCQAEVASKTYDDFPGKATPKMITVKLSQIETYLGLKLSTSKITKILEALGCEVALFKDSVHVTPPTFRPDITIPADVIEEIARIYGYYNLPSTLMTGQIPLQKQPDLHLHLESQVKHFLADVGWQEVYTYSLVSEALAAQSGYPVAEHLKLQNPLTEDRVYLRRSLLPSLGEVLTQNPQRPDLSVFEIANVYEPQSGTLPTETLTLSLVSKQNYRLVRGSVEALLDRLFVTTYEVKPLAKAPKQFATAGTLSATDSKGKSHDLGVIGQLKTGDIGVELTFNTVFLVARTHPTYQPLPKTMPIVEDLTFSLPEKTPVGKVITAIQDQSSLVKTVTLKSIYHQNFTFTVEYWSVERNLEANEVLPIRIKIVKHVTKHFGASLVGALQ